MKRFYAVLITVLVLAASVFSGCTPAGDKSGEPGENKVSFSESTYRSPEIVSHDGKHIVSSIVDTEKGIYKVLLNSDDESSESKDFDIVGRDFNFFWSPDSRRVCAAYSGRIWGDFSVIDAKEKVLQEHPSVDDIIKAFQSSGENFDYRLNADRPDPYLTPIEWSPDSKKLLIFYQWYDTEGVAQNGVFIYNAETAEVSGPVQYAPAEGDYAPIKKPELFSW